jgi:hypothetical protein
MQMDRPVAEPDIVIIEPGEWPLRANSSHSGQRQRNSCQDGWPERIVRIRALQIANGIKRG